ncbi:MAG: hypothetical protein GC154_01485 [bacterium]|nr:hypothetical protein [bacterium]
MNRTTAQTIFSAAAATAALSAYAAGEKPSDLLGRIHSDDANVRCAAWQEAGNYGADEIPGLAEALYSKDPGVVRAADFAMDNIVHSAAKEKDNPKRKPVTEALIGLLSWKEDYVRVKALRLLSLIADEEYVGQIAPYLYDPYLQEEAIYCIQRIPGSDATNAIVKALDKSTHAFLPRLLAALQQRADPSAAQAAAPYVESNDYDLAVDAMRAMAYMGDLPDRDQLPNFNILTPRQQHKYVDSVLLYCDALIDRGDVRKAGEILDLILKENEEVVGEHVHCAAIVSISKIKDPRVKEVLQQKAENGSYIVRDTAKKALESM